MRPVNGTSRTDPISKVSHEGGFDAVPVDPEAIDRPNRGTFGH